MSTQLILPLFSEEITLINQITGFQKKDKKIYYFLGQAILFQHEEKDIKSFRFITSQLIVNGNVSQAEVVRAFKVSARGVQRYVKKFREGGAKAIFAKKKGRKDHILTQEVVEKIRSKLEEKKTKSQIAKELGIKYDTLLKGIKRKNLIIKKKL